MRIKLNGESREIASGLRLDNLLTELDLNPQRVAVELNRIIVKPADFSQAVLREDDELEIVHFVGGG